jgi:hypothetical protein
VIAYVDDKEFLNRLNFDPHTAEEHSLIKEYCIRVRAMLWPDWDNQLAQTNGTSSNICKIRTKDSPGPDDENDECSVSSDSRKFRNSFYHLSIMDDLPETLPSVGSILSNKDSCLCDDEMLYVCTRCTTSTNGEAVSLLPLLRNTSIQNDSPSEKFDNNQTSEEKDRTSMNGYGTEGEYFDDGFENMEVISGNASSI